MKQNISLLLLFILACISCQKNEKRSEIEQIVSEWTGKTVKYPQYYSCNIAGNDTISTLCSDLFQKEYKLLVYIDSAGCSECRLKLFQWRHLIAEADSLFQEKLSFLFFFQPKSKKELSYLLKRDRFDYPVFIDRDNLIEQLNHFPAKDSYRCFLLDKNNKVLLIGNPVLNPKVWDLYKQIITDNKDLDTQPVTTVAVAPEEIEIPDLSVGKKSCASFKIFSYSMYRVIESGDFIVVNK